jgi:hypothetical protein
MKCQLSIALPVALLGAAVFVSSAPAQMRAGRMSAPGARAGMPFRSGVRAGFVHQRPRRFPRSSAFLLPPYFYPDYDYNYDYGYEPVAQEPPPAAAVAPAAQPAAPAAPPPEPLVLEYRDDQWVRVASYGQSPAPAPAQSAEQSPAPAPILRSAATGRKEAAQPPPPALPPAILVFRDGHREEIEKYTIMGGSIYTSADYWSTGSWTREVPIAELDVAATLKLNQQRGGKLTLPSGPHEVVIRP